MLYPCILCIALLMDLFILCVCELVWETIQNMFGCGCYFLLNVMEVFIVGGGALLDRLCMVFKEMCVLLCIGSQGATLFMFLYVESDLLI